MEFFYHKYILLILAMRTEKFTITYLIVGIINLVFSLAIIGLAIRFLFRLLGANPEAGLVQFVYASTRPLLDPFRTIFQPDVITTNSVFEYSTLIAILFYMLLAWLLVEFVRWIDEYLNLVTESEIPTTPATPVDDTTVVETRRTTRRR